MALDGKQLAILFENQLTTAGLVGLFSALTDTQLVAVQAVLGNGTAGTGLTQEQADALNEIPGLETAITDLQNANNNFLPLSGGTLTGPVNIDDNDIVNPGILSHTGKEINVEEGQLTGGWNTDGDPLTIGNATSANHAATLAQVENYSQLTSNPDGTCTLQIGGKSVIVGVAANPPTAMMLDAGSAVVGGTLSFDLSTVTTAGDDPTLTYSLDGANPKASAITLDFATGIGSIDTTGLVAGDLCQIQYTVTDGAGLSAVNTLAWTQTEPVPTVVITPATNPGEYVYSFELTTQNLDGTEVLGYFGEDGSDLSTSVTSSGLPVGALPASGQTINFGLLQIYQNNGLQDVTLRITHPTHGVLDEFVYPALLPSGDVLFVNVQGTLPDSQTADLKVDGIKIGTAVTGAGYSAGGLTENNTNLNGIHPLGAGPIASVMTLDYEFGGATVSVLNLSNQRGESIILENTSNPNAVFTPTSLGLPGHETSGDNPITLTSTSTSTADNNSTFNVGAIQGLRVTQNSTTGVGTVITRFSVDAAGPNSIVILGDSRMRNPNMDSELEAINETFFTVQNDSVSGAKIVDFAAVVDTKVAAGEHYDIGIVMVGTNSAVPGAVPQMFADLRGAVEASLAGNLYDRLLLFNDIPTNSDLNPIPNNILKEPVLRAYADMIDAHNWGPRVVVLDSYDTMEFPAGSMRLNPAWANQDGLHVIQPGYEFGLIPLVAPYVNE